LLLAAAVAIAEYFLTCKPNGPPLPEGGTVPASHVTETVQPDLVQNTLRESYRDRLTLLINEFGTALAGNPKDLNERSASARRRSGSSRPRCGSWRPRTARSAT